MSFEDPTKNTSAELIEDRPTPGGSVPEWTLYEPKVMRSESGELVERGVKTPEGTWFGFDNGEKFSLEREAAGEPRLPFIALADGGKVSFEAWKELRTERFKQLFEQINPDYGRIYMQVLSDFPELQELDVKPGTKDQHPVLEFTGGFWERPVESEGNPAIVVVLEEGDHYGGLVTSREDSARIVADMLGITLEDIKRNPKILRNFILLHEIGHAHDYIANYKYNAAREVDPDYDPLGENIKQRKADMDSLPYPGHNPVTIKQSYNEGKLQTEFEQYQEYFKKKGITSAEQLVKEQEKAYRSIESEVRADSFATLFLRKHWTELGMDKGMQESSLEQVASKDFSLPFDEGIVQQVYEKCSKSYEGKYVAPLFGINVELDETELTELYNLIGRAEIVLHTFLQKEPGNAHLAYWERILESVRSDIKRYGSGSAKGTSSTYLAKNLKELSRFAIETAALKVESL